MTPLRVHVFVIGRVQGVFFRESTRQRACELGLTGWVRNLADGRVEAVFEGSTAAVEAAVAFVREGPAPAQVDAVEIERESATGEFPAFQIRSGGPQR